ncbi:MAG: MATE family efflux transporter [Bacteroidales bacterium]|nr:MATE family efflux transporter [Bacteroidales bacterium]
MNTIAGNSFVLITLISFFFATVGIIFNEEVLRLFGATDKIVPVAKPCSQLIFCIDDTGFLFCVSSNNLLTCRGQCP